MDDSIPNKCMSPTFPGFVKINFDGFVRNNSRSTGVILSDNMGNNIVSRTYNLGKSSLILAEAITLSNDPLLAIEHNIRRVFIQGDNLLNY